MDSAGLSASERALGRRVVSYLEREAANGRMSRSKLHALAAVLGVAGQAGKELAAEEDGDGRQRCAT